MAAKFINPFTDVGFKRIFGQLPSFNKSEDECETNFERWIYVLKNMESFRRMPFQLRSQVFMRLEEIVDIASMTKEDRMKYDESIKVYRDNLVTEQYAIEKGIALGIAEGIALGIAEGIELTTMKFVKNMKAKGLSLELIPECTDIPIDRIKELLN